MSFFTSDIDKDLGAEEFVGMVVEIQKNYAFVVTRDGDVFDSRNVWLGTVQGKFSAKKGRDNTLICVGDIVVCSPKDGALSEQVDLPRCLITKVRHRKNVLKKPSKKIVQTVASNIDQVIILVSISQPRLNVGFLDRYLVLCAQQNIQPLIVFNKSDLLKKLSEDEKNIFNEMLEYYKSIAYSCYVISAKKPNTIRVLKKFFSAGVSLIVGQSGVGKSSLVNLLSPELIQAVDEFGPIVTKGRHVTSFVSMVKIKAGGYLIDTPGIKSLFLNVEDTHALEQCFPEFHELLGQCKYRDCSHRSEAKCAIKDKVESGAIHPLRYQSYLKLIEEIEPKY